MRVRLPELGSGPLGYRRPRRFNGESDPALFGARQKALPFRRDNARGQKTVTQVRESQVIGRMAGTESILVISTYSHVYIFS